MEVRRMSTPRVGTEVNVQPRCKLGSLAVDFWEERRMAWERANTDRHGRKDLEKREVDGVGAVGRALLLAVGFHAQVGTRPGARWK